MKITVERKSDFCRNCGHSRGMHFLEKNTCWAYEDCNCPKWISNNQHNKK